MRVFLSAGEPSGDHHAAVLIRALREARPDLECIGLGGREMASAGCVLVADLTKLAVMWFLRVVLNIHRFVELARLAERSFLDSRPDALVMVDFPGFHWWLAWRAKRHGIPVVFYCPPQIWAWGSWRAAKMRRLVDLVLSALAFEHEWFLSKGMASSLVGHPFFDEPRVRESRSTAAGSPTAVDPPRPLVLLLPGSRGQEVEANIGSLLDAAGMIQRACPRADAVVAAFNERHGRRIRERLAADGLDIPVEVGRTRELIACASAAIAVSGSVSLELLVARVPSVIVYRVSGLAYVVQSWFRHARFITLVNLLATDEPIGRARGRWLPPGDVGIADPTAVYPEYLVVRNPARQMAAHVIEWLEDESSRTALVARLDAIVGGVAHGSSATRAAAEVLRLVDGAGLGTAKPSDARVRRAA